ncbi:hypothetical protein NPA31_017605, partial [Aurantimonas sp. MSK8Z-1]|uniref:hypothetical protein n=1 Tax=Mangrovibrevibacter kandeliae TaxID=2968473 RepID=UPI00223121AF
PRFSFFSHNQLVKKPENQSKPSSSGKPGSRRTRPSHHRRRQNRPLTDAATATRQRIRTGSSDPRRQLQNELISSPATPAPSMAGL